MAGSLIGPWRRTVPAADPATTVTADVCMRVLRSVRSSAAIDSSADSSLPDSVPEALPCTGSGAETSTTKAPSVAILPDRPSRGPPEKASPPSSQRTAASQEGLLRSPTVTALAATVREASTGSDRSGAGPAGKDAVPVTARSSDSGCPRYSPSYRPPTATVPVLVSMLPATPRIRWSRKSTARSSMAMRRPSYVPCRASVT